MKRLFLRLLCCLAILWGSLAAFPGTGASGEPLSRTQEQGRDLYQRLACHGCHSPASPPGSRGPDLGQVGQRLPRGELLTQLLTPRQRRADSRMPSFAFVRPQEIGVLVEYLMVLP